jgi:hypothetical protein
MASNEFDREPSGGGVIIYTDGGCSDFCPIFWLLLLFRPQLHQKGHNNISG